MTLLVSEFKIITLFCNNPTRVNRCVVNFHFFMSYLFTVW